MGKTLPSTTSRGYGSTHQRERAKWEPIVAKGGVMCARQSDNCTGKPIQPDQPWDLGHNDDRTGYNGPECVPCNRGAGARNATAVRMQRQQTTTRDW
jgi:hypothetical protein